MDGGCEVEGHPGQLPAVIKICHKRLSLLRRLRGFALERAVGLFGHALIPMCLPGKVEQAGGSIFPPKLDTLLAWSTLFRSEGTWGNYLGYVKTACVLVKVETQVFDNVALKRARASVQKGLNFQPREKMWIQKCVRKYFTGFLNAACLHAQGCGREIIGRMRSIARPKVLWIFVFVCIHLPPSTPLRGATRYEGKIWWHVTVVPRRRHDRSRTAEKARCTRPAGKTTVQLPIYICLQEKPPSGEQVSA